MGHSRSSATRVSLSVELCLLIGLSLLSSWREALSVEVINLLVNLRNLWELHASNVLKLSVPERSDLNSLSSRQHNCNSKLIRVVSLELIFLKTEITKELAILPHILNRLFGWELRVLRISRSRNSICGVDDSEIEVDFDEIERSWDLQLPTNRLQKFGFWLDDLLFGQLSLRLAGEIGDVLSGGTSTVLLAIFGWDEDAGEPDQLEILLTRFRPLNISYLGHETI